MQTYQTEATTEQPKTHSPKTEVLQALGEFENALRECSKLLEIPTEGGEKDLERFAQMRLAFDMMITGSEEVRAIIAEKLADR